MSDQIEPRASQDRIWGAPASQHRLWERAGAASNEPTSPQGARSVIRTSFSNVPRTILVRFWSILARFWILRGSFLVASRRFFDAFALALANSLEEEATSGKSLKKHRKTIGFYMFSTCPRLRARCEYLPKIFPNALLDRVARRITFESRFFRAPKPQNAAPRALWGVSGCS